MAEVRTRRREISLDQLERTMRSLQGGVVHGPEAERRMWEDLQREHPHHVLLEQVGTSRRGHPIRLATVSERARANPDRGHLSIDGAHAPEFRGKKSAIVGSWLIPRLPELRRRFGISVTYRALVGDIDGLHENTYFDQPLTPNTFVHGQSRPWRLSHCVDYGMPEYVDTQQDGSLLRSRVTDPFPEAVVVAELMTERQIRSVISGHGAAWDMLPYANANEDGDPRFHRSASTIIGGRNGMVHPFDIDWPRRKALAPGVFAAARRSDMPRASRGPAIGGTIVDYALMNGLQIDYLLPELLLFRAVRRKSIPQRTRQAALDHGSLRSAELIERFGPEIRRLPLRHDNRFQRAVASWLEAAGSGGEPTVDEFIPEADPEQPASHIEDFVLGDRRVFVTAMRLASAGRVAFECGATALAQSIRSSVDRTLTELPKTTRMVRVTPQETMLTMAYLDLMAIGGSLDQTPFAFPSWTQQQSVATRVRTLL